MRLSLHPIPQMSAVSLNARLVLLLWCCITLSSVVSPPDQCHAPPQLQVPRAVCPAGQSVQVVTGSYLNDDVITHPLLLINQSAISNVNNAAIDIRVFGLSAGERYYSNVSLISKDSFLVSQTTQNFSK